MAAPKGNTFWIKRKSSGRKRTFKNPKEIWELACDYFAYIDSNPFVIKGSGNKIKEKKQRPYTIEGLCVHMNIVKTTWYKYKSELPEDDPQKALFEEICEYIDQIIYDQKFSGAAIGEFHHQIIARSIGLVEKVDIASGGKPVQNEWHIHPTSTKDSPS